MRSGGKETAARQRPNSGCLRVSEVRFATPNPFETKRKFDGHRGCLGVSDLKVAEGENLAANSLSFQLIDFVGLKNRQGSNPALGSNRNPKSSLRRAWPLIDV